MLIDPFNNSVHIGGVCESSSVWIKHMSNFFPRRRRVVREKRFLETRASKKAARRIIP